MPLYACNSSAGAQRRHCTRTTGSLGRSGAIAGVQRVRWDAAEPLQAYNGFPY